MKYTFEKTITVPKSIIIAHFLVKSWYVIDSFAQKIACVAGVSKTKGTKLGGSAKNKEQREGVRRAKDRRSLFS